MTDLDRQAAEFEALRAKRKSRPLMTGPTNHAAPASTAPAKRWVAPSQAALQARAALAQANRELAETKARLATAQADLANRARVASVEPAKPAAPVKAASALITASEFAANPPHMTREEFSKLPASDKLRFVREGGKIVD